MTYLVIIALILIAIFGCEDRVAKLHQALCPSGQALMLNRNLPGMPDTYRACFEYAGDCTLIADFAQRMEPNARWFCR